MGWVSEVRGERHERARLPCVGRARLPCKQPNRNVSKKFGAAKSSGQLPGFSTRTANSEYQCHPVIVYCTTVHFTLTLYLTAILCARARLNVRQAVVCASKVLLKHSIVSHVCDYRQHFRADILVLADQLLLFQDMINTIL
jgi:hypothetical protein